VATPLDLERQQELLNGVEARRGVLVLDLAERREVVEHDEIEPALPHALRIPIQSGQGFRFDVGRRSDLMSATIPK
jgi:hypothetical protein